MIKVRGKISSFKYRDELDQCCLSKEDQKKLFNYFKCLFSYDENIFKNIKLVYGTSNDDKEYNWNINKD